MYCDTKNGLIDILAIFFLMYKYVDTNLDAASLRANTRFERQKIKTICSPTR